MPELSAEAEALVLAGRSAQRPSPTDRVRIAAALRARLGEAALPQAPLQLGAVTSYALWGKLLALAAAASIAGALAVFVWEKPASAPPPPSATYTLAVAHTPAVTPSSSPAPALGSSPAPVENAPEPRRAPSRRPQDGLAREVAILSRATSALNAGRAARALEILAVHRRTFPNGLLTEERRAARAQALCVLGRRGEAQVELKILARTAPQSPNTARANQVCGVGASSF